jgi:hypothetical protein
MMEELETDRDGFVDLGGFEEFKKMMSHADGSRACSPTPKILPNVEHIAGGTLMQIGGLNFGVTEPDAND